MPRHHARIRRAHDVQAAHRARGTGLGGLGLSLRQRRLVFGACAVQCGGADEALRMQLLLALVLLGGHVLRRLRGAHLGVAGQAGLVGCAGVDAQQQLPCAHAVAGLHVELHHGPAHLGRDAGLAHGFDHAVEGQRAGASRGAGRYGDQRRGRGRGGGGQGQGVQQGAERGSVRCGRGVRGGHAGPRGGCRCRPAGLDRHPCCRYYLRNHAIKQV
jgi:hypothetical protein